MPRSEFHPFLQCHKLRNIFLSFAFRLNYIRETNASFIMQSLFFEIVNIINEISLVTAILFTVLFWRHEESCILHREVESTWAQLIVSQSVAQSPENTRLRCEWWIHREHYVGHESIRVNFFLNHHACCLSCNPPPSQKCLIQFGNCFSVWGMLTEDSLWIPPEESEQSEFFGRIDNSTLMTIKVVHLASERPI